MKSFNQYIITELKQKMPSVFYHATFKANLPDIKKKGLDTRKVDLAWEDSRAGIVYLANNPDVAESYAESAENVSDEVYDSGIVILKINARDLDQSKIKDDSNVRGGKSDTFEYHGVIPWKVIREYKRR